MTDSELNWANLPKKVIKKICSNINKGFLVNIRLVNKHWLSSLNELVFYSLENWNPESIPELVKKHGCCIKSWSICSDEEVHAQLVIDKVKSLESITWNSYSEPISTLNKLITKFPFIRRLSIGTCCNEDQEKDFAQLLKLVKNLKHLDTLKFGTNVTQLLPLFDYVKDLNLKKLIIDCEPSEFSSVLKAYNSSLNLKSLSLNFSHYYYGKDDEPTIQNLISPNLLEYHPSLEHYSMRTLSYQLELKDMKDLYGKELLLAFENPKFKNLKSFTWRLQSNVVNNDIIPLFNTPINYVPKQFPNLTSLSLELCDSQLLYIISKQFPKLVQLNLNCLLPLPQSEREHGTFKYLTKLEISGYHHAAVKSPSTTKYIFPSVSTLKISDNYINSEDVTNDLAYLPILFPNLKRLFCSYDFYFHHVEWHTVIDSKESFNWEELYINVNIGDEEKIVKLIKKLSKLKILYLHNDNIIMGKDEFKGNGDACIIRAGKFSDDDFNFELFQRLDQSI